MQKTGQGTFHFIKYKSKQFMPAFSFQPRKFQMSFKGYLFNKETIIHKRSIDSCQYDVMMFSSPQDALITIEVEPQLLKIL